MVLDKFKNYFAKLARSLAKYTIWTAARILAAASGWLKTSESRSGDPTSPSANFTFLFKKALELFGLHFPAPLILDFSCDGACNGSVPPLCVRQVTLRWWAGF